MAPKGALEQGDPKAQALLSIPCRAAQLGLGLGLGLGIPHRAPRHQLIAAHCRQAQHELGVAYAQGNGVVQAPNRPALAHASH